MQPKNPTGVAEQQPNADEHNIPKSSSPAPSEDFRNEIIGWARRDHANAPESIKLVINLGGAGVRNLTHLLEINIEDLNRVINGEQAVSIVRLLHTTDKEIKLNLQHGESNYWPTAIEQDMGE